MNKKKREIEDTNAPIRILIIDDYPDDRTLIIRKLKKEFPNLTTREIIDEKGFSKAIQAGGFDAVITDYHLCWTNGLKILRAVKARYPYCPVIMLTGTGNEILAVEAMKAGLDDYVIKSAEHFVRVPASVRISLEKCLKAQKLGLTETALKESEWRLAIKNRIADIVLTVSDDKMYGKVLQVILEALKSRYGVFGYIDVKGALVCPSMTGEVWDKCRIPEKDSVFPRDTWGGIWGRALVEKKALYSNTPSKVPEGHIPITKAMDVPIIHQGKPIGNILVANKETDYNKKNKAFLKTIADYMAPILHARLERDIKEQEKEKLRLQLIQAQKMEAIGTLTGGIAHDFNNLLTAIIGNAQLALMNMNKDNPLQEYIEEIKSAGETAASMTSQLLTFSRKQVIRPRELDINEEIQSMKKMIQRMIGEDVEFLTRLSPDLWKVHVDPGQINQVIMNLLVNARDAMPLGGKITLETANIDIDSTYFQDYGVDLAPGAYVMLTVIDTGIGMDEKTRQRIFEPFFTTKEIGHGTGLGLSTVYGIVKQNNGYIRVYSEPEQGTTFRVYFPEMKKPDEKDIEEQDPAETLGGSETVMIIEDEEMLRNMAQKMLRQYGYTVLAAKDGKDALKVAEGHKGAIHLVLSDVVMPGISGKETVERLQSLRPDIRVIYMSGYLDDAITRRGIISGEMNFIEKPFTPEKLAMKVREVLDQGIDD